MNELISVLSHRYTKGFVGRIPREDIWSAYYAFGLNGNIPLFDQ